MYSMQAASLYEDGTEERRINLTGQENKWQVTKVEGLGPPPAQIHTTQNAAQEGSYFNRANVEKRNIILHICPNGDVEYNRRELYKIFKLMKEVMLYYQSGTYDVQIKGMVENVEVDHFETPEELKISIICNAPCWEGQQVSSSAHVTGIYDETLINTNIIQGDEDIGIKVTILVEEGTAQGFEMTSSHTYGRVRQKLEYLGEVAPGDTIVINTTKGTESIAKTNGTIETDEIGKVMIDSDWLQLKAGQSNQLRWKFNRTSAQRLQIRIDIEYTPKYWGV